MSEQIIQEWETTTSSQDERFWAETYHAHFTLRLVEQFKACSDSYVLSDKPAYADKLIGGMEVVAQTLSLEPLAAVYVAWAKGNAHLYREPAKAAAYYQQALEPCKQLNHVQYVVRLLGNLLGALCQIGDFPLAQEIHQEILTWGNHLRPDDRIYLLVPAQNYAFFLDYIGEYQHALQEHQYARQLAVEFQEQRRLLEINVNYALTLANLGQLAKSEQHLLDSLPLAADLEDTLTIARIYMNLGALYTAQARPADALRALHQAEQGFRQADNLMEAGSVLLHEAELLARIGAFQEASRCYGEAKEQFAGYHMSPHVGLALLGGAVANRMYGRYDRAQTLLQEAEGVWQTLKQSDHLLAVALEEIALKLAQEEVVAAYQQLQQFAHPPDQRAYPHHFLRYWWLTAEIDAALLRVDTNLSSPAQAEAAYIKTLAVSQAVENREIQRNALVGLAQLLFDQDPHRARELLQQAQTQDDLIRQALSVQELKASFLKHANHISPLLALLAIREQFPEQALLYTWHAKGTALLELIQAAQQERYAQAQKETTHDRRLDEIRHRLAALRWQVRAAQSADRPEVDWERAQPEIQELTHQLQTLRRRRNTQTDGVLLEQVHDPTDILARMNADLLIEYVQCSIQLGDDAQIWAICADQNGNYRVCYISEVETLYDLQEELLFAFENVLEQPWPLSTAQLTEQLAECQPLLERLYTLLLAPLGPLPPQARLLVAPCASLFGLPFAAFRRGQRYLIEEHEINYIPTGGLLGMPVPAPATGTPLVVAASAAGQLAAVQDESAAIQTYFAEAQVLVDEPGTIETLQNRQDPPRFLHIAAHTTSSDYPLQTAFHLAGELLTVEACSELNLQGTAFVNLSGCNTTVDVTDQDPLQAWQSAFLIAGAHCVMSTLWPVADHATATFMQHFYRLFSTYGNPQTALHQTQRLLLAAPNYCHPVFWAPFVAYHR